MVTWNPEASTRTRPRSNPGVTMVFLAIVELRRHCLAARSNLHGPHDLITDMNVTKLDMCHA